MLTQHVCWPGTQALFDLPVHLKPPRIVCHPAEPHLVLPPEFGWVDGHAPTRVLACFLETLVTKPTTCRQVVGLDTGLGATETLLSLT
jgi:hypothetical protein